MLNDITDLKPAALGDIFFAGFPNLEPMEEDNNKVRLLKFLGRLINAVASYFLSMLSIFYNGAMCVTKALIATVSWFHRKECKKAINHAMQHLTYCAYDFTKISSLTVAITGGVIYILFPMWRQAMASKLSRFISDSSVVIA